MYLSLARDPGLSSLISRLTLDELWLRLVFYGAGDGVALIVVEAQASARSDKKVNLARQRDIYL